MGHAIAARKASASAVPSPPITTRSSIDTIKLVDFADSVVQYQAALQNVHLPHRTGYDARLGVRQASRHRRPLIQLPKYLILPRLQTIGFPDFNS